MIGLGHSCAVRALLAVVVLAGSSVAQNLEPRQNQRWSSLLQSGCNYTTAGSFYNLSCELGSSSVFDVYRLDFGEGSLCQQYSLTCSSPTGRPSCYFFSNRTESLRFSSAGQLPAALGLYYEGGCTGGNGSTNGNQSTCTAYGVYPDQLLTEPQLVITKTDRAGSNRMTLSVDCNPGTVAATGPTGQLTPPPESQLTPPSASQMTQPDAPTGSCNCAQVAQSTISTPMMAPATTGGAPGTSAGAGACSDPIVAQKVSSAFERGCTADRVIVSCTA